MISWFHRFSNTGVLIKEELYPVSLPAWLLLYTYRASIVCRNEPSFWAERITLLLLCRLFLCSFCVLVHRTNPRTHGAASDIVIMSGPLCSMSWPQASLDRLLVRQSFIPWWRQGVFLHPGSRTEVQHNIPCLHMKKWSRLGHDCFNYLLHKQC